MKIINWTDFRTILLGELAKHLDLETTYNNGTHLQAIDFLFEIIRMGDSQPIIEPQKKGVWIKDYVSCYVVNFRCSHCGWSEAEPARNAKCRFNYCPKCGSKNEVVE